ncbi:hypothetical protein [Neobacillus vireti]|uniref:hypothetical protein n=1 Tax=Neobacillus vireti TaxID=220686 RepID=UPI003000AE60
MKRFVSVILLSFFIVGIMSGFHQYANQSPSLFVQSKTKDNNVFVECIVTGISFRESDQKFQKVGKFVVWLDGKRSQEVNSAAFIIKDLSPGRHEIKLEVVDLNNKPYGLTNEFMVNISK